MNSAQLSFNGTKWEAKFNGVVLARSTSREYVIGAIRSGNCQKANKFNVTNVAGTVDEASSTVIAEQQQERFSINERFSFVTDLVTMAAKGKIPSVVITGEGGLGKTHTVLKAFKDLGKVNTRDFLANYAAPSEDDEEDVSAITLKGDYTIVKGFSTAKGLYRTLYENRDKTVIFDDCDSIQKDPVACNLLKSALDSYDERWLSWNSEAVFGDNLPRSFKFNGQIVFISNMPMAKIDQAIRSRSMCIDLAMTAEQKIERMSHIVEEDDFMTGFEVSDKKDALNFIDKHKVDAKEISLRTLIAITKIRADGSANWEKLAEYILTN